MIKEIKQLSDVRSALGRGGYVVEVKSQERGSRIHRTDCPHIKLLRKSFGEGKEHKHNTDTRYFHSKGLCEAQLFWTFERVEPDILPCKECTPCWTEESHIPDCDRNLYDWMKLGRQTIAGMETLMLKFIDAYALGGQNKDAFVFQARATRKLAERDMVCAVEISGDGRDVDILLHGGLNIQVWRGKYEPDYESERAGHSDSRVYHRSRIEAGAINHKLDQLPDGEKGFVVNLVPGDTMYDPPASLLTVDRCVISSMDCKRATIWRHQNFKHISDARLVCSYLDWKVTDEKDGMNSDILLGIRDRISITDWATFEITDIKTGEVKTVHSKDVGPEPPDDSWCGCG